MLKNDSKTLLRNERVASIFIYGLLISGYFVVGEALDSPYRALLGAIGFSETAASYIDAAMFVHFVVSGFLAHMAVQVALILHFSSEFATIHKGEVRWRNVLVSAVLTVALSVFVFTFLLQKAVNLHNALGFFSIGTIDYLMTGALVGYIKYLPIVVRKG